MGGLAMYEGAITALMLVVAAIHLVPISGFFGARRLSTLYGIDVTDADLEILMRHRAVLFGILGVFFAYAAFTPAVQPIAFVAAVASLASFFFLAFSASEISGPIRKIVIGDLIAAICLVGAIVLYLVK
jgi:hypothetical protein